jgi:hypothetical protein
MDVAAFLNDRSSEILEEAKDSLGRAPLPHYGSDGALGERLEALLRVLIESIRSRDLAEMLSHAERVAAERFASGYGLPEVQTAFNVLEEAVWHRILSDLDPSDHAEALALVGVALGAGKDALARSYVSLATESHVPAVDTEQLFGGT